MAKTLCPNCGWSPIPANAEECPACHEPFAFVPSFKRARRLDRMAVPLGDDEGGNTIMGGTVFTGAVSVHPRQAVAVFLAAGFAWLVRASAAMGEGAPGWTWALVGAALLSALLLYIRRGPSKLLAQFSALGFVFAALLLGYPELMRSTPLMYAINGAVALLMVSGEPGPARRWVGFGLGLLTAALAIASLALPAAPGPDRAGGRRRQELVSEEFGFRLRLPSGFRLLEPGDVTTFRAPPVGNRADVTVAAPGLVARLTVSRDPAQLPASCETHHRSLGGAVGAQPLREAAPAALGPDAVVYPLVLGTGAQGKLACGLSPDGRFLALAVVSTRGDVDTAQLAFVDVGAGLRLQ